MCFGAAAISKVSPIQTPATMGINAVTDTLTAKKDDSSSLRKNLGAVMQNKSAFNPVINNMKLG